MTLVRLVLASFFVAAPAFAEPIGYEGARHLLNRTGFGASDSEVRAFAALDRAEAVDRILSSAHREATLAPPAFATGPFQPFQRLDQLSAEERQRELRERLDEAFALREWWLREMLATPSPLTERMTLFWHGHFATSQQKVRLGQLMYRQNALLREHALGSFAVLLHAIAKDAAMLVYLDNARSHKAAPNENFAREVMELFTLGEGHYTEKDVKEAARAFTGWSVDRDTGTFVRRVMWHDRGEKTVLGSSGRFDGDDVLKLLLARRETAEFITAKLWREFVSPVADPYEVKRVAAIFRSERYEVKPVLRALLLSEAFWDPRNRGTLVKSPVELVVGTLRLLDIRPVDVRPAVFACALLGQNLFAPPNVKGWPGGEAWINSATLLGRKQIVERVLANEDRVEMTAADPMAGRAAGREARAQRAVDRGFAAYRFEPARWQGRALTREALDRLVLAIEPAHPVPSDVEGVSRLRLLAADPVFQLK